jgi:DNA-binding NtrC family response regulator
VLVFELQWFLFVGVIFSRGIVTTTTGQMQMRHFGAIAGDTPGTKDTFRVIRLAALARHPVLIIGERGTRKENIARVIHSSGPHVHGPFVALDCSDNQAADFEREFKGRETDIPAAIDCRKTIFLDHVSDLCPELQGKLLQTLQRGESSIGGSVMPRVIAASAVDLSSLVRQGIFRRDLYFRLNVIALRVPPLRERRSDIPGLVTAVISDFSRASGYERELSDGALEALVKYDWPGNLSQLESLLERAWRSASGPVITLLDLPADIGGASSGSDTDATNLRVALPQ